MKLKTLIDADDIKRNRKKLFRGALGLVIANIIVALKGWYYVSNPNAPGKSVAFFLGLFVMVALPLLGFLTGKVEFEP